MDNSKKYSVLYIIILILALVIMIIGVTFTYFTLSAKDKDDSTQIRTGTLVVNYIDGKTIDAYNLFPISEPSLNDELYVYKKNFSVANNGTLDQTLKIYIDITKNEFVSNDLMYALYDINGKKISVKGFPKEGRVLIDANEYLKSGESKSYEVLIWLNETGQNQNVQQDSHFTGQFDIEAEQIKYE